MISARNSPHEVVSRHVQYCISSESLVAENVDGALGKELVPNPEMKKNTGSGFEQRASVGPQGEMHGCIS